LEENGQTGYSTKEPPHASVRLFQGERNMDKQQAVDNLIKATQTLDTAYKNYIAASDVLLDLLSKEEQSYQDNANVKPNKGKTVTAVVERK